MHLGNFTFDLDIPKLNPFGKDEVSKVSRDLVYPH